MGFDYDGFLEVEQAWREGLLTVSEWADRHRILSSTSPVERVVFMAGGQLGKTECGNNWIGYVIHHAPGPMMAVSPTMEMAGSAMGSPAPMACANRSLSAEA